MNQQDLRQTLAETLDMLAKLLPATNEAFALAHAIYLATASQDPNRAVLIDSHFQRLLKPSKESVAPVLATIDEYIAKLKDDSLWEA
jgi:hypothetical protein